MNIRERWPLPYNVITGWQIINIVALLGWSWLFLSESINIRLAAFDTFHTLIASTMAWGSGLLFLALSTIAALLPFPEPQRHRRVRFTIRIILQGISSAWWLFCAVAFTFALGFNTGSVMYAGMAVAGLYETIRTVRMDL